MGNRRRLIWTLSLALLTAGCSLSTAINHQALDYFDANDTAANQIILLNIIRARYGAPLHFSELSQIRGQLSVGASASATFPFGPFSHATTVPRRLGTLGLTVSSAPSFDISSLDTKDFTQGVMTPITPQTVEFFLDEGIDSRMVLLLLVSGIYRNEASEMVLNAPESSRVVCYTKRPAPLASPFATVPAPHGAFAIMAGEQPCPDGTAQETREPEFYTYLRAIDSIPRLYAVTAMQPGKSVGPPFALDIARQLKTVSNINPQKYSLQMVRTGPNAGKYQLVQKSSGTQIVLCGTDPGGTAHVVSALAATPGTVRVRKSACDPAAAPDDDDDMSSTGPADEVTIGVTPGTYVLKLRSTLEVIQYVGALLALQDRETFDDPSKNPTQIPQCITLQPQTRENGFAHATCTGDGELFHVLDSTGVLTASPAVIRYDGAGYALPLPPTCSDASEIECDPTKYDHTLQTMAMISLLLNQNKSAQDKATTPAVQAVP
jgi:hypothetical protein